MLQVYSHISDPGLGRPVTQPPVTTTTTQTTTTTTSQGKVQLLPTGSKERGVLGIGSIPVAILLSVQDVQAIAL